MKRRERGRERKAMNKERWGGLAGGTLLPAATWPRTCLGALGSEVWLEAWMPLGASCCPAREEKPLMLRAEQDRAPPPAGRTGTCPFNRPGSYGPTAVATPCEWLLERGPHLGFSKAMIQPACVQKPHLKSKRLLPPSSLPLECSFPLPSPMHHLTPIPTLVLVFL